MARFRITARGQWKDGSKKDTEKTVPVESFTPGTATDSWGSEKVMAVSQLKKLFVEANTLKKISFLMQSDYSLHLFPNKRKLDFLSVDVRQWSPDNSIMNPTCPGAEVLSNSAVKNSKSKVNVVTLKLAGDGFEGLPKE